MKRTIETIRNKAYRLNLYSKRWSKEELDILNKYYSESFDVCVKLLREIKPNRSISSITAKANSLGLIRINKWTDEEDEILREYYPTEGILVQNRLPNRSKNIIYSRVSKLKIRKTVDIFSEEEINILQTYYPIEGRDCFKRITTKNTNQCVYMVEQVLKLKSSAQNNPKAHLWTEEEDEIIKEFYSSNYEKICELLPNRNFKSIQQRASKLGIVSSYVIDNEWTKEEIKKLKKLYPLYGISCYNKFPGRTKSAVHKMATTLNLKHSNKVIWTEEEKEIVDNHYSDTGLLVVELLPNKTRQQLISYVTKNKIRFNNQNTWSEEDIEILKNNYPTMGLKVKELLQKRSTESISAKASELGLKSKSKNTRKVRCITTGEVFNSLVDAAKKYNIKDTKQISSVCMGKAIYAGKLPDGTKLHWEYVD